MWGGTFLINKYHLPSPTVHENINHFGLYYPHKIKSMQKVKYNEIEIKSNIIPVHKIVSYYSVLFDISL